MSNLTDKGSPKSTISLAWLGTFDVMETQQEVEAKVTATYDGATFLLDLGTTTLTLPDGNPLHFNNKQFVAVYPKGSILYHPIK
jgi:predicted pyridoxine 5'-phosphate oxidase superfamily flavin-nucleotide-binding protein